MWFAPQWKPLFSLYRPKNTSRWPLPVTDEATGKEIRLIAVTIRRAQNPQFFITTSAGRKANNSCLP